jgi:hypothetical protein
VPDEQEVSVPHAAGLGTAAEDVRLDARVPAERHQRRVRDRELLVRGRCQRQRVVLGEERLAGLEVDRYRPGARLRDVRHGESARESRGERRVARRGRGCSQQRERRDDDRQTAAGHPLHSSERAYSRQAWASPFVGIGRAALVYGGANA